MKSITYDSNGEEVECMKQFDGLLTPCDECLVKECEERKLNKEVGCN